MTKRVPINKHIEIQYTKGGSTSHIVLNKVRYNYVGLYGCASAAFDVACKDYPGQEWVIIPLGGWGNPAMPGLFIAED